ncbi:hypothetical protein HMN09_01048100 [Mycena chlorophos]|uniref:Uncharacterized protein n=1 Tax=Mycena chlorophos TaxID=658473 RepID=A0A8H6VY06_MYCCL|nr:hypothetical protein HMN09_01048100 [Mycena chlorophos]
MLANGSAARSRRHAVCIFPSRPVVAAPVRKSTLLPYYHSPNSSPSINSPPAPVVPRPTGPLPVPPMYHHDNTSSPGSTPQATFAETDSEVSSLYDYNDFPTPPVAITPAIRRMQSSPLFTPEETDAVRDFLRRRWGAKSTLPVTPPLHQPQQYADFSWYAETPDCNSESAEMEQLAQVGEALLEEAAPKPHPGPLRVLRRATSMAPLSPILEAPPTAPPLPQSRTLRFQNIPQPSLASAGRKLPQRHRANLSMPVTPRDPQHLALGPSFTHRTMHSQPINKLPSVSDPDPRSFIDLSPDRNGRHSTQAMPRERAKVKRLLVRAKSTLIEWSKGLAGKKGV